MFEELALAIEASLHNATLDFYVGPLGPAHRTDEVLAEVLFENKRIIVMRRGHGLAGAIDRRVDRRRLNHNASR